MKLTDEYKWNVLREWAKRRRRELHGSERNRVSAPFLIGKWGGFDEVLREMARLEKRRSRPKKEGQS